MASAMARIPKILGAPFKRVYGLYKAIAGFYKESRTIFVVATVIILLLILLISLFSSMVARIVGTRGAIAVDLGLVWLFARFVARALMFPGSVKIFQRNTEAGLRTELCRQYSHYLRQLRVFLRHAARESEVMMRGVSADGVYRGLSVVTTLCDVLRTQPSLDIKLSAEQERIQVLALALNNWLCGAAVRRVPISPLGMMAGPMIPGQTGPTVQLHEWLRSEAVHQPPQTSLSLLMSVELVADGEETARAFDQLQELLLIMDEQVVGGQGGILASAMRFFQPPPVGSLDQLRAELKIRFHGQQSWVRTSGGHRIDSMIIPRLQPDGSPTTDEAVDLTKGPTIIWCNPNAAYYEQFVYQSPMIDFWRSRGVNIFVFNYAGYGRSSGAPSPSRLADDADAIVAHLKSRGAKVLGVIGRSIGGVAACHLARHHPDVVQLLIADRTMATLEGAAQYLYGNWAAKGLRLTSMVANNTTNFWDVKCYKLLICDPKDHMILDQAALRTGVALRFLEQVSPEERLQFDDARLLELAEVWKFFIQLFVICESDEDGLDNIHTEGSNRQLRPPPENRAKATDNVESPVGPRATTGSTVAASELVNSAWLQENPTLVRGVFAMLSDQVRSALDIVGDSLEGGGVSLTDVLTPPNEEDHEPIPALQALLANMQVWGCQGEHEDSNFGQSPEPEAMPLQPSSSSTAPSMQEIEMLLRKSAPDFLQHEVTEQRLDELVRTMPPEVLAIYHRRLARMRVAALRQDFRRRIGLIEAACNPYTSGAPDVKDGEARLVRTVLVNLGVVDSFISDIGRFFSRVDLAIPPDHEVPEEWKGVPEPRPIIDRAAAGYLMHVDCGHNGCMDSVDLRQLQLHLRAANFGFFAEPL